MLRLMAARTDFAYFGRLPTFRDENGPPEQYYRVHNGILIRRVAAIDMGESATMRAQRTAQSRRASSEDELDAVLVRDVMDGNMDSFTDLYYRHSPAMRRLAGRFFPGDTHLIGTAIQEAFLSAEKAIKKNRFDPAKGTFRSWITSITWRKCLTLLKQEITRAEHQQLLADRWPSGWEPADQGLSIEDQVIDDEQVALLLRELPPHQRKAIRQVLIDGLKYEEAAQESGESVGTIGSRVARGRRDLRKLLRRRSEDEDDR
jgi:RNA polymerase sigma-70 factor, ECF subfamily